MRLNTFRTTLGPLLLMSCSIPFVMMMWYTNTALKGSLSALFNLIINKGFFSTLYTIWWPICLGSPIAWFMIFVFISVQAFLLLILPGKLFYGPVTPQGNIPIYRANGITVFVVTLLLFCFGSLYFSWFSMTIVYDNFGPLLGALNCLSLIVCLLLYLKGRYIPSSTDSGTTGQFIFDYYWGTELYPTLGKINLKMFINCRLGMMSWAIIIISFAGTQQTLFGLSNAMIVSVLLQLFYIAKFFYWETGYFTSLDIMHDRAGFYICWGCLVWVPGIYTSPTLYLVQHPNHLSDFLAYLILVLGTFCILINYLADRQRQKVRASNGASTIWGKKPRIILASYTTVTGEEKQSILLSSGFWGISRHFHYLPEIAGAFFWSLPALFENFSPYFYVTFLSILLIHRALRDDERCRLKYGAYWDAYCQFVPFKIIPYVY